MDREAAGKLWKLHKNGFPGFGREAVMRIRLSLFQQSPHQVLAGHNVGEEAGFEGPAQGLGAGVGGADADDVGAAFQNVNGDLNGKILLRLDDGSRLVEVVNQHPPTGHSGPGRRSRGWKGNLRC